jgi:hypothetical protein
MSFARIERQRGLVHAQPQFAILAPAEHESFVHLNFLTLGVRQVHVAHRDGDVAVNLDPFSSALLSKRTFTHCFSAKPVS